MPVEPVERQAREDALVGNGFHPFGYPYQYGQAYGEALRDKSRVRKVVYRFGKWLVYRASTDRERRKWDRRFKK